MVRLVKIIRVIVVSLVLFIGLFPDRSLALSSPNIPIDDPIYRDLDKLMNLVHVRDVIYGQRPWNRSEIAKIVAKVAQGHREKKPDPIARNFSRWLYLDRVIKRLETEFCEEMVDAGLIAGKRQTVRLHLMRSIEARYTVLDNDVRNIYDNGLGEIDAVIAPLGAYSDGQRFVDGHNLALETESDLRASRFFSAYLNPGFQFDLSHGGEAKLSPYVKRLYAKFTVPHFEILAGRDSIIWGQGRMGGLLLSNNARPLDQIRITNPSPSSLPSFLKYLGLWRYTLFLANQGPEDHFPYSYLSGYKVNVRPSPYFELGFNQLLVFGGNGAPAGTTFQNILGEFLFGVRVGDNHAVNITNRLNGFDWRIYVPSLQNVQMYGEIQVEDSGRFLFMLKHLSSYQLGLSVPTLGRTGDYGLHFDYQHTSPFAFRHGIFTSGMTLNRHLLASELGPDGNGFYVTLDHEYSSDLLLDFKMKYESRVGDTYIQAGPPRQLVTIVDNPDEGRFGLITNAQYKLSENWKALFEIGYEHVTSFNFSAGDNRENFLLGAGLRYQFSNQH